MVAERSRVTTRHGRAIVVRPARSDEQGYVASTWARGVMDAPVVHTAPDAWKRVNVLVDRLLDDPSTRVLVAADPADDERLLGFVVFAIVPGARTLMYVSARERKRGIATELVERAGLEQDHKKDRLVYLFDGPDVKWLRTKREDAIKMEPEDYLS